MNRLLSQVFLGWILSFSLMMAAYAEKVTYQVDPDHSYVLWQVSHFGFSDQSGKWMVAGTIEVDEAQPQNSKVNIKIKVGDVITGNPRLDQHLRTEFFEVDKFPIATFTSDKLVLTNKERGKLYGHLTLHGVTKPIMLEVKVNKRGVSPITNKQTVGFVAHAKIKRSDFGISAYLPGVGDEVKLHIQIEAFKV